MFSVSVPWNVWPPAGVLGAGVGPGFGAGADGAVTVRVGPGTVTVLVGPGTVLTTV
jgi:hypothetical protein